MRKQRTSLPAVLLLLLLAGAAGGWTRQYDIEIVRRMAYGAPHPARHLDLYRPLHAPEPLPLILALAGGSWLDDDPRDLDALAQRLASRGYAVAAVGYRPAPEHTFPAQLDDARTAARWLVDHDDDYALDASRMVALGISAGGQLAALLGLARDAGDPAFRGVIIFAAPMDFTLARTLHERAALYVYLGKDPHDEPDLYQRASPITHVTADAPPFFIAHGTEDAIIPLEQSQRMARALDAAGVPVTLLPLAGVAHALPGPHSAAGNTLDAGILEFLARCREQRAP